MKIINFVIVFIFQTLVSVAIAQEMISVLVPSSNSPISTSSGVIGSLQCTKNSDESYAVCASYSNTAIKYNLQPFSFAAKGPDQGSYMTSCDLYETSSQSTSRAVCVKGYSGTNGIVYFHGVSDMSTNTSVTIGVTSWFPHVIVDTPNQVAYVSNNYNDPPAILKINSIGSSSPVITAAVTSFGSSVASPAAMLIIGDFLFVHFIMTPTLLARINIATFKWNQTVTFADSEQGGQLDDLVNDNNFIYDLTTQHNILVRCTYTNNNFARFDSLGVGLFAVQSLAISPDFSFLLLTADNSGIFVVNTSTFTMHSGALLPNPTSSGYVSAIGRPIILTKNNNTNTYPICAFSQDNDFLYTFQFSHVPFQQVYTTIYPLPSSPIHLSPAGVVGSLQCTKNSDESYAVCASTGNTAIKYNLQPFSFAAKGSYQGDFMISCDLYETSSQSTSRAVCVKSGNPSGFVYFHRVSDMSIAANIEIGATDSFPHVIVDTSNQVAYISNSHDPPAIYKITNIGSSTPLVVGNLTSFGSGDAYPAAMLIIDGFLYVHFSMSTASRLGGINISSFTWNQTVAFAVGESGGLVDNLANDDNFIYDLTSSGILVRCTYKNNNFAKFGSLNTGLSNALSLAISPDQQTLFVASVGNSVLQMVDVTSFAMFGNTVTIPAAWGRSIVTSLRNVYAFSGTGDIVYSYRYSNPTRTQSFTFHNVSTPTFPITTSRSESQGSRSESEVPSATTSLTHSSTMPTASQSLPSLSETSPISLSRSSSKSRSSSRSLPSSMSISHEVSTTESETIVECNKISSEYKCNSSHCQWCHDLAACVRPTVDCSSIQCRSFTTVASSIDPNLCPNSTCQYCSKTRTCLNRTEDLDCSCAIASTSSLACGASPGECFWCKNEFSYFGRPPNSVSLCVDNGAGRPAPDQFCSCEFLSKDVCNSKNVPCDWCESTGGCFDRSVKTCDEVHCTDFTNVAANGQCPSPACQICDGICVDNNTEYSGDRCSVKYFDQTTCEGCHNCTWNEEVLAGVNDAKPYCVMSRNAASCPSPLTCSSINLPGFDRENQCLAAGCKYDKQKQECANLRCFSFFLNSWVIQPIGLLIIGFVKDVVVLLLFGIFGDRAVKIFKKNVWIPFKFWKNKWDRNRIKMNFERTIYVNDLKARDFTSDKSESFEEYCQKIAENFFELPETNDEEIRKDWKRRIVDAVTFAMFDTGLWFDLDDDGYGKLDDEKATKKSNGVEVLMINANNENEEQEVQQSNHFTPREIPADENDSDITHHAMFRKLQQQHEKTQLQLQFYRENASKEVTQRFNDQFTNNATMQDLRRPAKKLFIPVDALIARPMLQAVVQRAITENATCVLHYASSRVTSVRAATALNQFPSPLQLVYYLLGIVFLVSSSFASVVLNDKNRSDISRIASYTCSSSNSTSSSAASDVGVFRSTFLLMGFRLMNASTVATVFLVLVKTVRAIWASYGGRFNQLQLPQRLPIMGLYAKRSSQILLGFYFGVVLIFALVGFFYGFKLPASMKAMAVTFGILICDIALLNFIRFITSRLQEQHVEDQKKDINIEEEELASRLMANDDFGQEENKTQSQPNNDFDEITAEEALEVKKQSLTNSAPTSLPQALIVFLLTEEFPTVLLTIALQLCYNYMCLVEYKSAFGFTDENMSEISTKEYESRSMDCIWELFQNDVSGYVNGLSSFFAFL